VAPWSDDVIAASGVMMEGAGCLWIPFLPVRAGGRLALTPTQIEFTPVLHWGWFARGVTIPISEIRDVQLSSGGVQFSIRDLISVGRRMTITTREGRRHTFRGLQIEELCFTLQEMLERGPDTTSPSHGEHTE
jgi:hypothetical protein